MSAAAGDGTAIVRWRANDSEGNPVAVALFASTARSGVYQGVPLVVSPPGDSHLLSNLTNGQDLFCGLAVDLGGGAFEPAGAILRITPNSPVYVDGNSSATNPDGSSPQQAFPDLLSGALTALALGGGNVWIRAGSYPQVAISLSPGVDLYGGFGGAFDLATRDPETFASVLLGGGATAVLEVQGGGSGSILDGLILDGRGLVSFGVDIDETPVEMRSLEIRACAGRGIRMRSIDFSLALPALLTRCISWKNGAQGLSLDGPFDLTLEGSRFSSNALEGVDLKGLLAPAGVQASLSVRDCVFFGNGAEGLDCVLLPPTTPGGSSHYQVLVQGSHFERNGAAPQPSPAAGLVIDIDFELAPGWDADILVRGTTARDNAGPGVHLDLDAKSDVLLHRISSTANGMDGLLVTSESAPSTALVSTSAFVGNLGHGIRATGGQVPLLVSHCVIAGNRNGGVRSDAFQSAAVSTVAWLQSNPWTGTRRHFSLAAQSPSALPFMNAPVAYLRATALDLDKLKLDDASQLALGDPVELSDDGRRFTLTGFPKPNQVRLSQAPGGTRLPALFAAFGPGQPVDEDYRLIPGSQAAGQGMPQPFGNLVDAGIYGSPTAGPVGREDAVPAKLFRAANLLPPLGSTLTGNDVIEVGFRGGTLDPASVSSMTVQALDAGQNLLAVIFSVQNGRLLIGPPPGGWPSGQILIELHAGIAATDSTGLAAPVAVPFVAG